MSCMPKWWQTEHSLYLGAVSVCLGAFLSLTALLAPYWREGGGVTEGLYYYCEGGNCHRLTDSVQGNKG